MKKNEITLTEMRSRLAALFDIFTSDVVPNAEAACAAAQVARAIVDIDKQRDMRRVLRKAMKTLDETIARHRKDDDESGEPS